MPRDTYLNRRERQFRRRVERQAHKLRQRRGFVNQLGEDGSHMVTVSVAQQVQQTPVLHDQFPKREARQHQGPPHGDLLRRRGTLCVYMECP